MNVENKNLVWWNSDFNSLIKDWLVNNKLDLLDSFNNSSLLEKEIWQDMGSNSYKFSAVTGLIDRKHEIQFMYNTKSNSKWIPFEEQPTRSFTDCMFDAAQSIADEGKTIDFFWSGGLDSTGMLIAFNELGLHKQLRVIMGGSTEAPDLFDKLIKGRIDYVIDETSTLNNTYSLAKPDKHVWTAGPEADIVFGAKANLYGVGISVKDNVESWNLRRRYNYTYRLFRMIANCNLDWIDLNNHKSFYTHPSIEKFVINHTLSGEMVFYDLTDEGWGRINGWRVTNGYNENAKGQEHYLSCKMPIRDFIYNFTRDKIISYEMTKVVSEYRMRYRESLDSSGIRKKKSMSPPRNIAVTNKGEVITRDNFLDHDWSEYMNINS